jgi:putative DNA primase/helicase
MSGENVIPLGGREAGTPRDPKAEIVARIRSAEAVAGAGAGAAAGTTVPPAPPGAAGLKPSQSGRGAGQDGLSGAPPAAGGGEHGRDLECARLPLTDLGNAQRFVRRHGDEFLFVPEWGWLAWDGRRWNREDADGLLAQAVHRAILAIGAEADALAASGEDFIVDKKGTLWSDMVRKWAVASQSAWRIDCIARANVKSPGLAAPYMRASVADFDADPLALNVSNGTLRFSRREPGAGDGDEDPVRFTPHDRADLITRLAPVEYDPEAACPVYDAALARVQPDDAVRRHLHCWGGVSLTGDVSLQRMAFWYGRGGNMKSTLLDIWAHVAGDYATTIGAESFLDQGRTRRGDQATPDLADLVGVRMLKTSEPERGAKLAEALIKTATGDENLKVRLLHRDFFQLRVQFHLTMFGNYKPTISGTDDGIWRRVVFVPWLVQVPEPERDPGLLRKLRGEASGILNRLLDGVRDWLDNGLVVPEGIARATADFRTESDPLGRFVEVCVERREGSKIQSSLLHRLYQAWCVANGEKAWSAKGFSLALGERGYAKRQSNVMWWLDVAALRSVYDFVSNPESTPDKWQPLRQADGSEAADGLPADGLSPGGLPPGGLPPDEAF